MMLNDKTIFITGGARNLGKRIAITMAEQGADAALFAPEKDEIDTVAAQIVTLGRRVLFYVGDVTNAADVQSAVEQTIAEWGRIDVLINNAGIAGPTAPLHQIDRDDWEQVLAVNLTGPYLCAKAAIEHMIARRSGKIINISSIAGKIGYPLRTPYCASKWALVGLTQALAKELGPRNIQVNAICPGPVNNVRMKNVISDRAKQLGATYDEIEKEYLDESPLGRMVTEQDVANLAVYLASSAGDNITGQSIDVTAGYAL